MKEIDKLKKELSREFEVKDLGPSQQILGMRITRDRSKGTLRLSQQQYIEKVLSRFNVDNAKPRSTPLANHLKLSKEQSPKSTEKREHVGSVFRSFHLSVDLMSDICSVINLVSLKLYIVKLVVPNVVCNYLIVADVKFVGIEQSENMKRLCKMNENLFAQVKVGTVADSTTEAEGMVSKRSKKG